MIDPESVAQHRRNQMRKDSQYFIPNFANTQMAKDTKGITDYFRVREYIKPRDATDHYAVDWLSDHLSEIWSSKYLGIENGFQKLEFQNPPYSAARVLGDDPRKYNNTFVIQLNGCDYECNYCYVDRSLNKPDMEKGTFFKVSEMINEFVRRKEDYPEGLNVIRLTGGEATSIVPEIIIDVCEELVQRRISNSTYVWADCNLSTPTYLKKSSKKLKNTLSKVHFGIVGCLKGIGNEKSGQEDFAQITNSKPEAFIKQFETLEFLVNTLRADTYVYLLPMLYCAESEFLKRLDECYHKLSSIHRNLPLRANMLQIRKYSAVQDNLENALSNERGLPWYNGEKIDDWFPKFIEKQRLVTRLWYQSILPKYHNSNEINQFRCNIPLNLDGKT